MDDKGLNIEELVGALVDGTISKNQLFALEAWTKESAANKDYVKKLRELFITENVMHDETRHDVDSAINRFHNHITKATSSKGNIFITQSWLKKLSFAVAAAIILILIPILFYRLGNNNIENRFSDVVIEVPNGSQLNLTLPDGTTVCLNSGSKLSYSQGFGITDRNILFSGEGFFNVNHMDKFPFLVRTSGLSLKDLGTEFSVCDYDEDEKATVLLFSGSVEANNEIKSSNPILMAIGESLTLNKLTGETMKQKTDLDKDSAMSMNDLDFVNQSISEIAKILSRSYGITIEVLPEVREYHYHGFFDRKEDTLESILNALSRTGQIHYKKIKDKYIIY